MTKLTRREALFGGTALALSPLLATAASADNAPNITGFYLAVTAKAFEDTYGDALTPENIERLAFDGADKSPFTAEQISTAYDAAIWSVLEGSGDAYRDNYIAAAQEYLEAAPVADLPRLERLITGKENYGGTLKDLVGNDAQNYGGGWRTNNWTPEATQDPLFAAFQVLHLDRTQNEGFGMLSGAGVREYVNVTKGATQNGEFRTRLAETVSGVIDAVPAPAPAPTVPERKL